MFLLDRRKAKYDFQETASFNDIHISLDDDVPVQSIRDTDDDDGTVENLLSSSCDADYSFEYEESTSSAV